MDDWYLSLLPRLEELRRRLIIAAGAWLAGFLGCYTQADRLFKWLSLPARRILPAGSSLVFLNPIEPFFTYLKLSAVCGLLVSMPVSLWQGWKFFVPAAVSRNKGFTAGFVVLACLCFLGGALLGFHYVFPAIMRVLV